MTSTHDARVASEQAGLLRRLVDRQLRSLVRYEWQPLAQAAALVRPGWSVFRLAPGPLVVGLDDGSEVAFASAPAQASVVVWLERGADGGRPAGVAVAERTDLFPIRADDAQHGDPYVASLIGARITGVELLQRQADSPKLRSLPRDAGVLLIFERGARLLVGHGLHDGSDDLAVLEPAQIDPAIKPQLVTRLALGTPAS
jgi:hypothetical protein